MLILYGDTEIFDGENPYSPTDMRLGIKEIVVSQATNYGGNVIVNGDNFTESSVVFLNGNKCETEYINSYALIAYEEQCIDDDTLDVRQLADNSTGLGISVLK